MTLHRAYRLGRRQAIVDATRAAILEAARQLVAAQPAATLSVGAVAKAAGVSRITVYNQFGSKVALLAAVAPPQPPLAPLGASPREDLRRYVSDACAHWASAPAMFRHLDVRAPQATDTGRALAERLAAVDELRPGCSIKEAEDVIEALTSFPVFDRLHRDGRRSSSAVADIVWRLSSAILN